MSEAFAMSQQDIDRLHAVRNVLDGKFSQVETGKILGLSDRQVRRLCARVSEEGSRGILHKLKGRPSNNRLDSELLERAVSALQDPLWEGFGPSFARDKLHELHGVDLSAWTIRKLMIQMGTWQARRRKPKHRSWRERRPCVGMLVQLDGSDHDWFEGRGPRCVLLAFIDDATSKILYGEFVNVEDTITLMRAAKAYIKRWGRPVAFYVDKDSIYKVNRQATVEEELRDEQPITQFARAMRQLGIEVIFANSPQAKGRVERTFRTHQDRLVKELRLRGICTIEAANQYLWEVYIPEHNARYAVVPANPANAHRPLLAAHDLDAILCVWMWRTVQNDYTVQFRNRFFQLTDGQPVRIRPKCDVVVQLRLDGSIYILAKGRYLKAEILPGKPYNPRAHPRIRSVRTPEPIHLYSRPLPPPPSDSFRILKIDPVIAFRRQIERDSLLGL